MRRVTDSYETPTGAPSPTIVGVDEGAEHGEQLRQALRLIDHETTMLAEKEKGVGSDAVEVERVLQVEHLIGREGRASQRRLAGLPRPQDGHDGELPEQGLQA